MSQKTFIIAADTSGSMSENSKDLLLRHLCEYVLQRSRYTQDLQEYQLQFLSWAQSTQPVYPQENGRIPLPSPSGRRQEQALISYVQQAGINRSSGARILLLTDEAVPPDSDLQLFLKENGLPAVQIIVGAETPAFRPHYGHLSIWPAEDIGTAVTELLIQSLLPMSLPGNLEVLMSTTCSLTAEDEEDEEDEW